MQKAAKMISVLLAMLMLSNSTLPALVFLSIQSHLKNDARNIDINDESLVLLAFSKTELKTGDVIRMKKSDEFLFRGNMYDIKSITETKDSVSFLCYEDRKEHEHIRKHVKSENERSQNSKPYKASPISTIQLSMPVVLSDFSGPVQNQNKLSYYQLKDYYTYPEIEAPPPKS
jgi:hypothetical protein